jgi:lipopolysaccharide/colanic/teichoic acid biosynthesis glycosyltransferase
MAYVERYSDMHRRRLETRPGITGLAQVSGRNSLSWDDKFMLDVTYVDGRGVLLDLKILARTAKAVIRRQGISAEGHATMTEFMGARDDA